LESEAEEEIIEIGQWYQAGAKFCGPFEILDRIGLIAYMIP
jgi:hypothetical protein